MVRCGIDRVPDLSRPPPLVGVEVLQPEYVFHVFQMTSEKSVFCPKYVEYGGIRMEYMNTYSKRGPKMDVFRIKFSSLRVFGS